MPKKSKYPTKKMAGDLAHSLVKAGVGMIPLVNAPANKLLNYLITPSLEKRRTKWFEEIGNRLKELEEKKEITLEELMEKDEFIDIAIQATQVALRTRQDDPSRSKEPKAVLKALSH